MTVPMTGRADDALEVETIDYHTGGEPFRIIVGGVPTRTCRSEPFSETTICNKSDIEYDMLNQGNRPGRHPIDKAGHFKFHLPPWPE